MTGIHPEAQYREFLAQGRFMIQRARGSGRCLFYPRVAEPGSGDTDLEWVQACGRGTVYSSTVVRKRPPEPGYNVALIDLEEGPRLMSRVIGVDPAAVHIGMAVHARIIDDGGQPLLVFAAADGND